MKNVLEEMWTKACMCTHMCMFMHRILNYLLVSYFKCMCVSTKHVHPYTSAGYYYREY
jgi:hypothetical protein